MAAPVGSLTVPRMVPRKVCAAALPPDSTTPARSSVRPVAKTNLQVRTHHIITFSSRLLDFIRSPKNCSLAAPQPKPAETGKTETLCNYGSVGGMTGQV